MIGKDRLEASVRKQMRQTVLGSYPNASIRTFTQQDPIGLAGGLNLYGFANGDPVNFSDPFGLCPDEEDPECAKKSFLFVVSLVGEGAGPVGGASIQSGFVLDIGSGDVRAFTQGWAGDRGRRRYQPSSGIDKEFLE